MVLIAERILIKGVVDEWKKQYGSHPSYSQVLNELEKLNLDIATADDIEKIIGNRGWTTPPTCTECNQAANVIVEVGEPFDNDTATAHLCVKCLKSALELAESVE